MSKQANQKKSYSRLKKVLLFTFIGFVVLMGFFYYAMFGSDQITLKRYRTELSSVSMPKEWQLQSESTTPPNSLSSCITYIDLTCPSLGRTYKSSDHKMLREQFNALYASFIKEGYRSEKNCMDDTCQNDHRIYYFNVTKGRTVVGASVFNNGPDNSIKITVE